MILAPRGHAKTTSVTVSEIVRLLLIDRNRRVLLVSKTQDQAEAISRQIASLLRSEMIRGICGCDPIKHGTLKEIWMRGRTAVHKEANLSAHGSETEITLRHFDDVFIDDVITFENTRKATRRAEFANWFGSTLKPCIMETGAVHWIGTRYHAEDFYGSHLLDTARYPDMVLNRGTHQALLSEDAALWPERFSVQWLKAERREMGSALFAAQYQNDASQMRGSIFKPEWFTYYDAQPEGLAVYLGFDPAISQSEQADYSALCAVGRLGSDLFVLDTMRGRYTFDQQINLLVEQCKRWRPITLGIEDVAYQRALIDTCRNKGLPVASVPRHVDKVARAYGIQGLFETAKIKFPTGGKLHELEAELLAFPEGEHDDLFDALETAIGQANRPLMDIVIL